MNIYADLITAFWIIFIVYWLVSAFTAKKSVSNYSWHMLVRVLVAFAVIALVRTPAFSGIGKSYLNVPTNPLLNVLGVILAGAGIAFAIWARYHLGKNWGMPMSQRVKPELITTGPYAYVRHPIYTGVIFAMLGSGSALSLWWLGFFIVFSVYFFFSAKTEEKHMMKRFPQTYPAYKKRTKMLIPFVF